MPLKLQPNTGDKMAILTNDGRALITRLMSEQTAFMAWGKGKDTWASGTPLPSPESNQLSSTVGFRKAIQVRFCKPDNAGVINVPSGKYTFTDAPGRHLYGYLTTWGSESSQLSLTRCFICILFSFLKV